MNAADTLNIFGASHMRLFATFILSENKSLIIRRKSTIMLVLSGGYCRKITEVGKAEVAKKEEDGGPTRIRTRDQAVMSRPLYR